MPGTFVAIIVILVFTAVTMLSMRQESKRYQAKQPRTFAELEKED
jgi:hypothetical protein